MSKALQVFGGDDKGGDLVPESYPVPQTEVHTERDIGPVSAAERVFGTAPPDNVIDAHFTEVADREPSKEGGGIIEGLGKVWDALAPAVSLGADELVKAMYTGSALSFHGNTFPEAPDHGLPSEAQKQEEHEHDHGRSM